MNHSIKKVLTNSVGMIGFVSLLSNQYALGSGLLLIFSALVLSGFHNAR